MAHFVAVQLAPITLVEGLHGAHNGRQGEHAGGAVEISLAFTAKVVTLVLALSMIRLELPLLVQEFLYTVGLYTILFFIMDGPAALASAMIGMAVSPHFDAPWFSTSPTDFWAKRWDLATGSTLRQLIYEPIREGHMVRTMLQPRYTRATTAAAEVRLRERRALGTTACFLVSGLMHELQFAYMVGHWSHGLMLAFFLAQVPLLMVERQLGLVLSWHGWQLPAPLRAVVTLSTLLLLSHWTFWAACNQYGAVAASVTSMKGVVAAGRQLMAEVVDNGLTWLA